MCLLFCCFFLFFFFVLEVAFAAQLTTDLHTNVGDVIKFDNVQLNDGGGYDDVTGRFTTPSNGTYEFTLITSTLNNDAARTDLMLGGYSYVHC